MWDALKEASEQPGVAVCVYVDADKGDPAGVKARLPRATVTAAGTETRSAAAQNPLYALPHRGDSQRQESQPGVDP